MTIKVTHSRDFIMAKEEDFEEELNESSIYDEEGREDLVADDEMSAEEEGFMKGYEEVDDKKDEIDAEEEKEEP